jgi:hypothetical protein
MPTVDPVSFTFNNADALFASIPQYDTLRISSPPEQQQLLQSLLDKLQLAFGPHGLGFLEVINIPSAMVELRSKLLPMAEQLANLAPTELQMLERPEQDWTVGWSQGKEHFTDGTYDMAKGSFYINPYFASEQDNPNVYPPSLQPQLEERLMTMTRFMSKVGRWFGKLCDLYLQRESGSDIALDDPWTISKSLASGLAFKARLLYYYPRRRIMNRPNTMTKSHRWLSLMIGVASTRIMEVSQRYCRECSVNTTTAQAQALVLLQNKVIHTR